MNNTELIKLISQYVHMKHQLPKGIKGYEKSMVLEVVNNMINKKEIFEAEIKTAPWEYNPNNKTNQYKRMLYYIDKELIKTEYGDDVFKI